MEKVLYLDNDGVLNTDSWFKKKHSKGLLVTDLSLEAKAQDLDPLMVQRLNEIVEATDCNIVISSSWRLMWPFETLREILKLAGFRYGHKIIGDTPRLSDRPQEIEFHIKANNLENANIVILDDWDMDHLSHLLVQTCHWDPIDGGLTEKHKNEVIRRLNK